MKIEIINVIHSGYGSSLNKLSEDNNNLILLSDYTSEDIIAASTNPKYEKALIYVERILFGDTQADYLKPLHDVEGCLSPMFGGNKGKLSDGRVLSIHDRYETQEQYEFYSH